MIEIPPRFAGRGPVGAPAEGAQTSSLEDWSGARGLAEDVHRYGAWMREKAFQQIGHLYPQVKVPGGKEATVIAWIWARTVASPNPAYKGVHVPLASTFFLSTKKGKEVWVEPIVEGDAYRFEICKGKPTNPQAVKAGTKLGRGANFRCLISGTPISPTYIKAEGKAGRMKERLMAVVAEGTRGRAYLPATEEMEALAMKAEPLWKPSGDVPERLTGGTCYGYGLTKWGDLFTSRQLVALTTFSDLVQEARQKAIKDALAAGWEDDGRGVEEGGEGATAYGDAVAVYMALGIDRLADRSSTVCGWDSSRESIRNTFGRQAIPMTWDYVEANLFSASTGNIISQLEWIEKILYELPFGTPGQTEQADASVPKYPNPQIFSTDPPYYDNIGYADLSDFFYVWLRRSLRSFFPQLFSTMLVPKAEELVATPYRHGGREQAETFFLKGMTQAVHNMCTNGHTAFPVTIYYAFKQSETSEGSTVSTGWEVFLEAIMEAGFSITGTWPMRTELGNRMVGSGTNALASSIVLVCRQRPQDTPSISRRQFLRELSDTLPDALEDMIGGKGTISPVAPVDLAQAAIGPGLGVFSQYPAVLEADGSSMSVHDALVLINKAIDEYFTQAEGEMDEDTRFCVDWFQQFGFRAGPFGTADTLARAKGTSVDGVAQSGVLQSGKGEVRLLRSSEYDADWEPEKDKRLPVWEACHQLSRALGDSQAEAGRLLAHMLDKSEPIRQLAYRLYTVCERKDWSEEARSYNELITSWEYIVQESQQYRPADEQGDLGL